MKKIIAFLFTISLLIGTINSAQADWISDFNVSGYGEFNGLYGYMVEGSTLFADIQNDYFINYDGLNGWAAEPKVNTDYFSAGTGTFHTTVDFSIGFSEPQSSPFAFDLELWWEPGAINTVFGGYENYDTSQESIHMETLHYAWDGIDWDVTTPTNQVPEPASMLLIGSGLIGIVGLRRKFKK